MRVLFVTSEIAPLIKTGGLADVSAALPAALHAKGVDVRVLLPGYTQVLSAMQEMAVIAKFPPSAAGEVTDWPSSRLLLGELDSGVPVYVLDCPEMYVRGGGAYQDENKLDWADNGLRFGLLSRIASLLGSAASPLEWVPEVLHCNDWQSALTPAYLRYAQEPAPCVLTVHNLAYQGIFPPELLPKLGLPWECYQSDGLEFYDNLSFLKAGLFYSDHITTVSPSYAKEIQTEELGFGLHGLLVHRNKDLTGILNGIDTAFWNPATDEYLQQTYSVLDSSGKAANKAALQKNLCLKVDAQIPLFGLVGRFAQQKGLDLVLEVAEKIIAMPAQLVLLGSGDPDIQRAALQLAHKHSGKIAAYAGFNEALAHQIEAGADIFLMPSRFEPCGLNQMYSQRYGTPPVVHATGGLIDTVVDCTASNLSSGLASGFVFKEMKPAHFIAAIQRAVTLYQDQESWRNLQLICMNKDFSWDTSAQAYKRIYTKLIKNKQSIRATAT